MKISASALSLVLASNIIKGVSSQCVDSSFEFKVDGHCKYDNIQNAFEEFYADPINRGSCTTTATDEFHAILGVADQAAAVEKLKQICLAAIDNYPSIPLSDVPKQDDDFIQRYYNGGTYWNEEVQTYYPLDYDENGNPIAVAKNNLKEDAARVKATYEKGPGSYGMIDMPDYLTNFDQCSTNAAYCCWPADRQANDNNGNCGNNKNDPLNNGYDARCVDKDPADNTNLCFVDLERGQLSTGYNSTDGYEVFGGSDGSNQYTAEGPIHCHGFAWSDDPLHPSYWLRGNNLFYVSMYDHMHQRGYVRNIPGAPMCACSDQMPVVSRADCTQIDLDREAYTFTYTASTKAMTATLKEIDIDFNACQGFDRRGRADSNDLYSYVNGLYRNGLVEADKVVEINKVLVGDNDNSVDRCDAAVERYLHEKNIVTGHTIDADEWVQIGGKEKLDPTGSELFYTMGPELVKVYYNSAPNGGIIKRMCGTCRPSHRQLYVKRNTAVHGDFDWYGWIKNNKDNTPKIEDATAGITGTVWSTDFDIYSTYEDAISGKNKWQCPGNVYAYGDGFPGKCSPDGSQVGGQTASKFDYDWWRKYDVGFYIEVGPDTPPLTEISLSHDDGSTVSLQANEASAHVLRDIGDPYIPGSASMNEDDGRIYMSASGNDIWDRADQFTSYFEKYTPPTSSDSHYHEMIVKVENTKYTHDWLKVGLMVRYSLDKDSAHVFVGRNGKDKSFMMYRKSQADWTRYPSHGTTTKNDPDYLYYKITKVGDFFTTATSKDGDNWDPLETITVDNPNEDGSYYAGLVVCSHQWSRPTEAVFADYQPGVIKAVPTSAPTTSPAPSVQLTNDLQSYNIGEYVKSGSSYYRENSNRWTIRTQSERLWGSDDHFTFVPHMYSGADNFTVTAKVSYDTFSNTWQKGGLMIRDTLQKGSKYYAVYLTGNEDVTTHWRSVTNSSTGNRGNFRSTRTSAYLKIKKEGNKYTAYKSYYGIAWAIVDTVTSPKEVIMNSTSTVYVGMAATSNGQWRDAVTYNFVDFKVEGADTTYLRSEAPSLSPTSSPTTSAIPSSMPSLTPDGN